MGSTWEVIVIGAGHAGCEAALAAARIGCRTLLLTTSRDTIALMPCNPSIGGPAKGHLVREIDALGGAMGQVIDRAAIQVRRLNEAKGPAVQALRAQADKRLYAAEMRRVLEAQPGLTIVEALVIDLLVEPTGDGQRITGVATAAGQIYHAPAVVLTTGTFLRGRLIQGEAIATGGRVGEPAATELAAALARLGFRLRRLKTGTPPRVAAASIDYNATTLQPGSDAPLWFSAAGRAGRIAPLVEPPLAVYPPPPPTDWRPQMACYLVHTTAETHAVIRDNLHRAPMFSGVIEGIGPRYCPSIEDKIVRFADKPSHGLFLEPEGWRTDEVYVQGANTSLPVDVQAAMLRAIPALRDCEIIRYGYAVEYDAVATGEAGPTLATHRVAGLFVAGQLLGTSGYEEAAAQGLLAGINAAALVLRRPPLVLRRDQAYIGVLIDDLVTKDIVEPYRMLTSRAEHRLLLRDDNADLRLTATGHDLGLVDDATATAARDRQRQVTATVAALGMTWLSDNPATGLALAAHGLPPLSRNVTAGEYLQRPAVDYAALATCLAALDRSAPTGLAAWPRDPATALTVQVEVAYADYIDKARAQVARAARLEGRTIPVGIDYATVPGLRAEALQALQALRPATVGQAGRIAGVTPSDVAVLLIHLERHAPAEPRAANPPARAEPRAAD
ncbi:MAG: tRNA uridine-5-carboxymethylaminomethyl(34) synthesis enzyme MnmG [Chloroflexi bacterium]|nr:tRNA uridine-5-carboxymethylaminomethyl(34) synthesis enzyme MnmG [Chloroflexota bacterium]